MTSNNKQLDLRLIGEAREVKDLSPHEIEHLTTPLSAVRYCMRGISESVWADYLEVSQGALNQIINADQLKNDRPRHFPLHWIDKIQRKAGNRAISQFLEYESKGWLKRQQQAEQVPEGEIIRMYRAGELRAAG